MAVTSINRAIHFFNDNKRAKHEADALKSDNLQTFLLELGKGFMYVGNQQRITLDNNTHYYVDMVFYNKILKCYT